MEAPRSRDSIGGFAAGQRILARVLVLLCVMAGAAIGYEIAGRIEQRYIATMSLLIGDVGDDLNLTRDDVRASGAVASAYARLIRSPAVLQSIAEGLDPAETWEALKERVHVEVGANEIPIVYVTVYGRTVAEARAIGVDIGEAVVAVDGIGGSSESQGVLEAVRQSAEFEDLIGQAEMQMSRLRAAMVGASLLERLRLQARVDAISDFIIQSQEVYTGGLLAIDGSPSRIRMLQPPLVAPDSLGTDGWIGALLGAAIGGIIGVLIMMAIRPASSRRPEGLDGAPGLGVDPRKRVDPWARELAWVVPQ